MHAGLKRAARGSLEMQDPKNRQKVAIWFWFILHQTVTQKTYAWFFTA